MIPRWILVKFWREMQEWEKQVPFSIRAELTKGGGQTLMVTFSIINLI